MNINHRNNCVLWRSYHVNILSNKIKSTINENIKITIIYRNSLVNAVSFVPQYNIVSIQLYYVAAKIKQVYKEYFILNNYPTI